jgi:hypothetical protein
LDLPKMFSFICACVRFGGRGWLVGVEMLKEPMSCLGDTMMLLLFLICDFLIF